MKSFFLLILQPRTLVQFQMRLSQALALLSLGQFCSPSEKDPLNYVRQNMKVLTKIALCSRFGLTKYETIDLGRNGHCKRTAMDT